MNYRAIAMVVWTVVMLLIVGITYQQANHTDRRIVDAQIRSCERVNLMRVEQNDRADVLRDFLWSAAASRENTADLARQLGKTEQAEAEEKTASHYRQLATRIDMIKLADCEKEFSLAKLRDDNAASVVIVNR